MLSAPKQNSVHIHNGSGVHPTFYTVDSGYYFPGVKMVKVGVDNSAPSSSVAYKAWSFISRTKYSLKRDVQASRGEDHKLMFVLF
jgi:hypothetical protein